MFEWTIEHRAEEKFLYVKTRGIMRVSNANAMVKAIADAAVQHACLVHLIDHRETTFNFDLIDYYDRPTINAKLGVSRSFRTAMVFRQLTKETFFMETVFQNRGFKLKHFTRIDEAKAWLKEK